MKKVLKNTLFYKIINIDEVFIKNYIKDQIVLEIEFINRASF